MPIDHADIAAISTAEEGWGMSELERYQKDLEAIKHVIRVFESHFGQGSIKLNEMQSTIQDKIKELEEPPDPFRRAKHFTEIQRKERIHDFILADYAIQLEDEVDRLKAELESRPVVWCLKSKDNPNILASWQNHFALFDSFVAAQAFRSRNNYHRFEPVIYTRKESE